MSGLINRFSPEGVVSVNRVVLQPEYSVDFPQERVTVQCENVETYHSDSGFVGGFVALNSGRICNRGSTRRQAVENPLKDREALIATFRNRFAEHERSHRSESFQSLFRRVLEPA